VTAAGIRPSREAFVALARESTVIPLVLEMSSDWWTPVAAFHLLAGDDPYTFLLESVEGGEHVGRYSFVGRRPFLVARARGGRLWLEGPEAALHPDLDGAPRQALQALFGAYRAAPDPELPPFASGAVGYFGFDIVRWVERLEAVEKPEAPEDDLTLLFLEDLAAFDHVHQTLTLVANARVHAGQDPDRAYDAARARLAAMREALAAPVAPPAETVGESASAGPVEVNLSRGTFLENVRRAKERIAAGDVFQVVLSQRFTVATGAGDLALYRALRSVNPSPYMFLLRLDGWSAVGSSPEPLVRVTGRRLDYRPIAGTAPRSGDPKVDQEREEALRQDPKERAEHVMLVDLGRNDLGRCAVPGTVRVEELMVVERYSHVMHLVSALSAELRPDRTALDALLACFPAGTVSGAPKLRALEIIEELEPDRRGLYGGAVGYLDFSGNLDTCIALRTMIVRRGRVHIQAGAGIVADSDPEREYEETRHKAGALLAAVARAEGLPGR